MNTIRTLIIDDERLARTRLRRLLAEHADLEILAECGDGPDAVNAIRARAPDLVILDINMPEFDGFGVLDRLAAEEQPKAVVFVTAYDEHAIKAFEASALDYLLKPVSTERLRKALDRVRQKLALLAATPQPSPPPIRFAIRSGNRVTFIDSDQIDWIEADGNYAILHVGDTQYLLRETMSKLDERLPATAFLRVSRSAIIRLDRVAEIRVSADSRRNAILTGSRIAIPITRPWREISTAFQK